MKPVRTSEASSFGRLGTAMVVLLLATSTTTFAQKNKPSSPPSHSAPSHSSPPPSHSSPPPQSHQSSPPPQIHQQSPSMSHPSGSQPPAVHGNVPNGGSTTVRPGGVQQTQSGARPGGSTQQNPNIARPGGNSSPAGRPGGNPVGNTGTQNAGRPNGGQTPTGGRPGGNVQNPNVQHPGGNVGSTPGGRPGGNVQTPNARPGGNVGSNPAGGRQFGNGGRPQGTTVVHTKGGGDVVRGANGSVREVHTPGGAVIHHAPDGGRRVEVSRPGGRVVVASARGRSGYVQRPLVVNNRSFVQRTYVVHGVSYARVYRPYVWGGVSFHVYTPYRFYRPAFYSYVFSPWARPVYYGWGWNASPWFGFYGGWFTPYPVYASPSLWLTDYLIAQTLQDAYQARVDAAASVQAQNYSATPLTPDVKQAIADEVRRQLDQEKGGINSTTDGPPPLFSNNGTSVFVVSSALSVNSQAGECPVTEGDVLQMNGPPAQNSTYANVVVLASKGNDCRKGTTVSVALNDLQEMQNQMRATVDQGLGDLQSKQGQNGLPTLPAGAAAPPDNAFGNQVQPDANVQSELTQVASEADKAEQDVVNQSLDTSGGAPPTISLGMTTAEVEQIMGRPKDVANVGSKKIYVYPSMKVIFIDGKVNDVQ